MFVHVRGPAVVESTIRIASLFEIGNSYRCLYTVGHYNDMCLRQWLDETEVLRQTQTSDAETHARELVVYVPSAHSVRCTLLTAVSRRGSAAPARPAPRMLAASGSAGSRLLQMKCFESALQGEYYREIARLTLRYQTIVWRCAVMKSEETTRYGLATSGNGEYTPSTTVTCDSEHPATLVLLTTNRCRPQ